MIRIFYFIIVLILFVGGLGFAVLNSQLVNLNYYFGSVQVPVSLLLTITIFVGVSLGIGVSLYTLMLSRREVARLRKTVRLAERDLTDLRTVTTKTDP